MNSARLWLLLAGSTAVLHLTLLYSTEAPLAFLIFAALIWASAALALEDLLPLMPLPRCSGVALVAAALLLALFLRAALVQTSGDPFLAVAPLMFGVALGALRAPLRRCREPLLALAFCPLLLVIPATLPNAALSRVSAAAAAFLLSLLGLPARQQGPILGLGEAAVRVAGSCAGAELIAQALVVGLLARVLLPLPTPRWRWPLLLLAPLCGWLANVCRIALLALIAARNPVQAASDSGLFGFFHSGNGGLIFSAAAISAYGLIHAHLLETQLRP